VLLALPFLLAPLKSELHASSFKIPPNTSMIIFHDIMQLFWKLELQCFYKLKLQLFIMQIFLKTESSVLLCWYPI
jgi:hypothetical protein